MGNPKHSLFLKFNKAPYDYNQLINFNFKLKCGGLPFGHHLFRKVDLNKDSFYPCIKIISNPSIFCEYEGCFNKILNDYHIFIECNNPILKNLSYFYIMIILTG